ncbi:MAG: class I SAM-dependent rRNA methyltransferase [Pseudomonadales bacterium]
MQKQLVLRKDQERRLKAGHCWIYSNEVDVAQTPLAAFTPGEIAAIHSRSGQWLGWGYVNPHTLICARLVSTSRSVVPGREMFIARIRSALRLRERLYADPFYRLLFGEGDGVPGLVVDRYGDILVVQITTAGMECLRDDILDALNEVVQPAGILLRNDVSMRKVEQLDTTVEVATGSVPDFLSIREGGIDFQVAAMNSQKTGWFFDQSANRDRLLKYVTGRRMLDVFSYAGGWGVRAAAAGAAAVTCVDSSESALSAAIDNAARNGVSEKLKTVQGDAFEVLKNLAGEDARFDVIVLDPPAFIKRRKDDKVGQKAYQRLNQQALELLEPDGVLVTASCSFHLARDEFLRIVQRSGRGAGVQLQLLEEGRQGADHPQHPAIAETGYLKAFYLRSVEKF